MKVFRYFKECWLELKKVSWPTPSEAFKSTWIVILVTLASSIFLGLFDTLIGFFMDWIF